MIVENVTTTQKAKDQLIKLKRATGIQNWNILCRWALCLSLSDPTPPTIDQPKGESAVEMSWKTFSGEHANIYTELIIMRCKKEGISLDKDSVARQFRLHLHRGVKTLAQNKGITDVSKLLLLIRS